MALKALGSFAWHGPAAAAAFEALDVGRRCGGAEEAFNGIPVGGALPADDTRIPVDRRAVLAVPVKQIRDIGDVS